MIECENPSCTYGWYHFSCVNIVIPPTGQWYCDDCKNAVYMCYSDTQQVNIHDIVILFLVLKTSQLLNFIIVLIQHA